MKQSLSYYVILFILKLKGIKKDFSKDPVDFKKLRKEDVYSPKMKFFRINKTHNFKIANTLITEVKQNKLSKKLLLFIHGGAFVSGPAKHHWDTIQEIVEQTDHTVWMCNYPKAPENGIMKISKNIDLVYEVALGKFNANDILLIGDSVGGTLITALIQRLIQKEIELPRKIILVSPVMDATMSNPKINNIDLLDPMLSRIGVLSAKKMCAENNDLSDVRISPINGSFQKFPQTILFLAEHDITFPDQEITVQKMIDAKVDMEVFIGERMPHIWPFLPVMKEGEIALKKIIHAINN
ncbi:MAG: alpha/beta hydrolase [Ginsengibacter sp.]